MSEIVCDDCMHHCHLAEGKTGFCRARRNVHGQNVCDNYGRLTSMAMDPIEKKPFARYYPGSLILSVGSYGCNLACPFCQNSTISMVDESHVTYRTVMPDHLAEIVMAHPESIGLAFTYNEPLISWEYIRDCAKILKPQEKKIVLVTNGCISHAVMETLIPYIDAMNIDLKGDAQFYKNELHGSLDLVKQTISYVYDKCHLEVTTLVIPGKNDSEAFIENEASWLSSLSKEIPLHLSRYFPRYHYELPATDVDHMKKLQKCAQKYLSWVYLGNVW